MSLVVVVVVRRLLFVALVPAREGKGSGRLLLSDRVNWNEGIFFDIRGAKCSGRDFLLYFLPVGVNFQSFYIPFGRSSRFAAKIHF